MLLVRNELDENAWDAFVQKHGPRSGSFLQSWQWGEFLKKAGKGGKGGEGEGKQIVDRLAWMSDGEIDAVAQVIHKSISKFGTYTYIPRGPIYRVHELISVSDLSDSDVFVRMEPVLAVQAQDLPERVIKTRDLQPAHTLVTDLSQSEEQLLSAMHEKTRYNIRLAEKKGVKIEVGTVSIDDVWHVFEMTSSRDEFRLHGKEYYRKMIETSGAFIAVAKHENDILAANIMIDFGKTRTYLHGASSNIKRNLMGPFLLHWELIKDAKSKGIRFYDWWGVAPVDASVDHAWAGISRFKRGFGGEEVEYPGTFDVVLNPFKYKLYQLLRTVRRGGK